MSTYSLVYFGLPIGALLLLEDGHSIDFACLSFQKTHGTRRLVKKLGSSRVLLKPDVTRDDFREQMRAIKPNLIVSFFWPRRLPKEILNWPKCGAIGVHPSLLPKYRGPDPYYAAILNGDAKTGVTVHRLEEAYDTGAILAQEEIAIEPEWNAWNLARALDRPALRLLRNTVKRFASGERVAEIPQDESLATDAPLPTEENMWINFHMPTEIVLRQIRALSPAPGAYTEMDGNDVLIKHAKLSNKNLSMLEPGEALVENTKAHVRTLDGAVQIQFYRD